MWSGEAVHFDHLALHSRTLVLIHPTRAQDELATLRPNRRPVLIVGGTRVPRSELACCRVGWDRASRAARPNSAVLRILSELAARVCCQLACLHGMGNRRLTHRCGEACASRWHHICVDRILVGGEDILCGRAGCRRRGRDFLCEAETCRARRRLVGDASP
jgi:hypothetical protein